HGTSQFPQSEQFGLSSQIRRASISIPLNIAEGAGAASNVEFQRFLNCALRSTYEVMSALEIAEKLGYMNNQEPLPLHDEADQIAAMIVGFSRKLD
ncbi:MAG: four helix bundle protein, partial [Anaerolineaceae bacterium]